MGWNVLLLILIMGQPEYEGDPRTAIMPSMEKCAETELDVQQSAPTGGGYVEAVCLDLDNLALVNNHPAK